MSLVLFGALAETLVHVGCGQDTGVIDLPVMRERVTGYPVVPATGMKGALRDLYRSHQQCEPWFGSSAKAEDGAPKAGAVLVGEARLVLLPVRSLSATYLWLTCPLILERLARDANRAGLAEQVFSPAALADPSLGQILASKTLGDIVFLEERQLSRTDEVPADVVRALEALVPVDATRQRLAAQVAIVSTSDFAWFAQNALPVQAHNVLDPETKASKNLWYEESLPPDTLLSFWLADRDGSSAADLASDLSAKRYVQVGGNESTGEGWLNLHRVGSDG